MPSTNALPAKALFEQIEAEHGPIEVLVFSIGANVPCSILEETARKYFKIWEMACFSGFLNAQAAAQRMVARELGPRNIHVAHVVVDGILNPEHIAENYSHLHNQPRDAWTFELDLRPYMERW